MSSILIIDDDVTLLARLVAQLEEAGFATARTSDLVHAEALYAEDRPDLVILEVRSGGGAGWELLGRLAAETPVVVLSGTASEEDVVRALEAGALDYIAKPYRSAELIARLRARLMAPTPPVATTAPANAATPPADRPAAEPSKARATRRRGGRDVEEESVFMSDAEEMALLRMPHAPEEAPPRRLEQEADSQGFGRRMRAERLGRHVTLVQAENDLRIRMSYLQAMEDEKFTLLPRGPAALQMVRAYADYLNLDAAKIVDEFRADHYVEANEPLPALGGSRLTRPLPRWVVLVAAVVLALAVGVGAIMIFDPAFFGRLGAFFVAVWDDVRFFFS